MEEEGEGEEVFLLVDDVVEDVEAEAILVVVVVVPVVEVVVQVVAVNIVRWKLLLVAAGVAAVVRRPRNAQGRSRKEKELICTRNRRCAAAVAYMSLERNAQNYYYFIYT